MKPDDLKNKKITLATLKSFIKKSNKLFLQTKSSFNGMTDGVEFLKNPALVEIDKENAIGVNGAWLVGSSRDLFSFVENETHFGIEIYNCCGTSILWTSK